MPPKVANNDEILQRLRALLDSQDEGPLRAFLADLHAADVADCLEQVEPEERSRIFFLLPPRTTAEAIVQLEEAVRSDVLDDLTDREVSEVLRELPADDAVDVLDELDDDVAAKVVGHLSPEQRAIVQPLRQYEEDTAGGIMNPNFIQVPAEGTVANAVSEIRRLDPDEIEDRFFTYCVDVDGKLEGVVHPMHLITATPASPIKDFALRDLITVHVDDDQEAVKNKFEKYDVLALPVVDDEARMVGVITHDDVLEVAEEEAEEDMFHMAGTNAAELARASIIHAASVRARWLVPCLAGTLISMTVMFLAEPKLGAALFFLLIPFNSGIAAMGGNAGVQTSTIIVRALATGDAIASSLSRAFAREFRIALLVGVLTGLLSGAGAYVIFQFDIFDLTHVDAMPPAARIGVAVGFSMTMGILVASTLAMTMPFLFLRLRIDPAIATGPLITTLNDGLSTTIYMLTAIYLLKG
jgi:magnesium transporter